MVSTAIIFPGQGSQAVGMGRDLVEISDAAARMFHHAGEILGFDLAEICFSGPAERLEATDIQQPAILVTSLALWAALTAGRTQPFDAAAGLSLGEYTALHIAGAMSFEDAVRLVQRRGLYMQEAATAVSSGMVSILGLSAADVRTLCREVSDGQVLGPANYNCPGQIVISGAAAACRRAVQQIESSGSGKAVPLKVAGAFHSDLMKPAADRLKADLDAIEISRPQVAVYANVDAAVHGDPADIRDALYRQVFSPVRWQECIEAMIGRGIERFVEVGPGRVLSGLLRKIDRGVQAVNISSATALRQFLDA